MAALTETTEVSTISVSPTQTQEASDVARQLEDLRPQDLRIRIESARGEEVFVPERLSDLLRTVLHLVAAGQQVGITRVAKALTSVEAAQVLGISRPTLIKLAAAGEIPSHKVGTHNRFLRSDLDQFAERRSDAERLEFNRLRDLEDSLDNAE